MTKDIFLGPSLLTAPNPLTNSCLFLHRVIVSSGQGSIRAQRQNSPRLMAHRDLQPLCTVSAKQKRADSSGAWLLEWGSYSILSPILKLYRALRSSFLCFYCGFFLITTELALNPAVKSTEHTQNSQKIPITVNSHWATTLVKLKHGFQNSPFTIND